MKTKLIVKPSLYVVGALAILLIPWQWLVGWIIAITVHELFHYMAIRFLSQRVVSLQIGFTGVIMKTDDLTPVTEVLCAAAGPIASLLLTLLSSFMPRIAVCGFFQFLYNLLPLYPQDGGRVLRGLLMCFLPQEKAMRIGKVLENVVILMLMCISIYICIRLALGLLPIILMVILVMKIKIPCK